MIATPTQQEFNLDNAIDPDAAIKKMRERVGLPPERKPPAVVYEKNKFKRAHGCGH